MIHCLTPRQLRKATVEKGVLELSYEQKNPVVRRGSWRGRRRAERLPLYQDALASELVFPIQNAEIRFAIAEDQEQVDKLLEILPQCPSLARIFYDDARGMRHYSQPQLASYEKLPAENRFRVC